MPDLSDAQVDQLIKDIGLRKPRGGSKRKPIAHGTYNGARQHRYRQEPLCDACHRAEADYQRERSAIRKGAPIGEDGKPRHFLTEEERQAWRAARNGGAQ